MLLVGLSLGLLGGGGSALTVPALIYLVGMEAHQAIAVSLIIVGLTSLYGAGLHWRRGGVSLKVAAIFTPLGMLGALAGARLSYLVTGRVLLLIFSGLLVTIALSMLFARLDRTDSEIAAAPSVWKAGPAGLAVGVLTGLLGVGGGFLIVPALIFFGRLSIRQSIGTSLLVIALNSGAALVTHLSRTRFDAAQIGVLLLFTLAGMVGGTNLSHRTSPTNLRRWFAILLLALAVWMGIKNV